jgi:hypothetical protein
VSNEQDAKMALNSHIKFLESLKRHINSKDEVMKGRAMWASWCVHRYFNEGLIKDIQEAICNDKP